VDEAVELPLPDAEGRWRLLNLYGDELGVAFEPDSAVVKRTDGVSAAFIRELLRRAALLATLGGTDGVAELHVTTALAELEEAHSQLTRRLLGADGGRAT
jgi:cell division protease FtsH